MTQTSNPTLAAMTRRDLRTLGASEYLAKRLTKALTPVGQLKRAYLYNLDEVLAAIQSLQENSRIRATTRQVLQKLGLELRTKQHNNTTQAQPVEESDDLLTQAMAQVTAANARFEATAQAARKISRDFETYRRNRGKDFKPRNNIVAF